MHSIKDSYCQYLSNEAGAANYNAFKRILYTKADSLIQTLNNEILQRLPFIKKDVLEVCDIGGGDGHRIVRILKFLHDKHQTRFRLDFIEQSLPYIKAFDGSSIQQYTTIKKIHGLFEDTVTLGKYDLILLIHSIFTFKTPGTIDKVLSLSKQDGKIIIISNAPSSLLGRLKILLDEEYIDKRYEIDVLQRELDKRQVKYKKYPFYTKWAISKDDYTRTINIILEWLSLGRYLTFSPDRKHTISEYIRNQAITFQDEKYFYQEDELVIIIDR